ncbi:hypothetical protein C1645_849856 [Glomus cerebriforme]|uniref:Uncharacterized protein n=1 Tax=Glomus cerebriforme TaxID=658196 RepID=A0A397SWK4_9GLOM|nr:hypothetical protein C1645_849856 [Glomus cerebriforme]
MVEIDDIWGRFKIIKNSIEDELIENYYNIDNVNQRYKIKREKKDKNSVIMKWSKIIDDNEQPIIKIEVNDSDIERNLLIMLIIIGLTAKDNGKIIIEAAEVREIYSIMEKMDKVKEKVMRRKWKIRNINYIERLLDITEKRKIFWSLLEIKKKEKIISKKKNSDIGGEIVDINELEETIPRNRYRLYWNRKLVNDQIREMVKKYNKFKYLGEWLTLKINKNILNNIGKNKIVGKKR